MLHTHSIFLAHNKKKSNNVQPPNHHMLALFVGFSSNSSTTFHSRSFHIVWVLGVAVFCICLLYNCILIINRTKGTSFLFSESTATYSIPFQSTAAEIWASEICRVSLFFHCTLYDLGEACAVLRELGVADLVEIRDSEFWNIH